MAHSIFPRRALFATLTFVVALASAQAGEMASDNSNWGAYLEQTLSHEMRDETGKQYWVRGGTATNQVFCDADPFPLLTCEGKKFGPRDSERFTIEAVNTPNPTSRWAAWFRVRFDSGTTGYLNAGMLRSLMFVELRYQGAFPDVSRRIYEVFFNERPELVLARIERRMNEQADAVRREKDRYDRSEIRVGMTKQQVLNNGWGPPERVREMVLGTRRREQWVYGTGDLYFDDGILTAVKGFR